MKLTPASSAARSAWSDVSSSTDPHEPPIAQAPKLIVETFMSVVPSRRNSIAAPFCPNRIGLPDAKTLLGRVAARARASGAAAGGAAAGRDLDRRPEPAAGAGGGSARRAAAGAPTVDGRG